MEVVSLALYGSLCYHWQEPSLDPLLQMLRDSETPPDWMAREDPCFKGSASLGFGFRGEFKYFQGSEQERTPAASSPSPSPEHDTHLTEDYSSGDF